MPETQKNVVVLAGNFIHKTTDQFNELAQHAPANIRLNIIEGPVAMERLDDADLLITAGLFWTGSTTATWTTPVPYVPATPAQRAGLERYVRSGRPVLGFHGGIASFDDWPEFGRLLGFRWDWRITTHGPITTYRITPTAVEHPITRGVEPFELFDENYYGIQIQPDVEYQTLLKMDCGPVQLPMLMTGSGGRVPGSGKTAYLALGHDHRATQDARLIELLFRTINWLLD